MNDWPHDTADRKLSFTKMMHELNFQHPHQPRIMSKEEEASLKNPVRNKQRKRFPFFTSKFGCHCPCKSWRHSDLVDNIGINNNLYFKLLKQLSLIFLVMSLIAMPITFIYSIGGRIVQPSSFADYMMTTSIVNIGENQLFCSHTPFSDTSSISLTCNGNRLISTLEDFGLKDMTSTKSMTCNSNQIVYANVTMDPVCSYNGLTSGE